MKELEDMFEVDLSDNITQLVASILDEGINQKEKEAFYGEELTKLFSEVVSKDVEKASLRMLEHGIVYAPNYDLLSGEL